METNLGGRRPRSSEATRAVRLGVGGAVLTFAALALLWMLTVPVFLPPDENGHVAYGLAVVDGHLPWVKELITHPFAALGQHGPRMYVGNHPPLYYVLTGPLEHLGLSTGHPFAFLFLTRGLGVLMSGAAIVLIALLAGEAAAGAAPRARAVVMIGAASLAAAVPSVVQSAGSIDNDPLMLLLAAATLLVLARAVRRGLTTRVTLVLAVLATLGMLSRLAFLPIAVAAVGCAFVLTMWPGLAWRPVRGRVLTAAVARAALVAAAIGLGSGWFYELNRHRYGNIAGALDGAGVHRVLTPGAGHGVLHYFVSPAAYWVQFLQLGGGIGNNRGIDDPTRLSVVLGALVLAVVTVGALAIAARLVARRGFRTAPLHRSPLLDSPGRWIVLGLLLTLGAAFAEVAQHADAKGWPSNRYMLPGLPGWAVAVSLLLCGASIRLGAGLVIAMVSICSVATVSLTTQITTVAIRANWPWVDLTGTGWWDALEARIHEVGLPVPGLVLATLLAAAAIGVLMQAVAMVSVARTQRTPDAAPARGEALDVA